MASGPDPLYSAETTRAILQRAAELQGTMDEAPHGLTLSEVQAAGAAAGLSPEAVLRAAREVSGGMKASAVDGRMRLETRLIAAPATDAAWEAILAELRWMTGGQSEERRAGAYDWAWRPSGYELARVRLDRVQGGTQLSVRQLAQAGDPGVTVGMGIAGAVLAAALWFAGVGPLAIVGVAVVLATLGVLASWPLRRTLQQREAAKTAALADRLAGLVASHAPPEAEPAAPAAVRPAIPLPDAGASPEAPASLRRNGPLHG